jgi:hypothetical protein
MLWKYFSRYIYVYGFHVSNIQIHFSETFDFTNVKKNVHKDHYLTYRKLIC